MAGMFYYERNANNEEAFKPFFVPERAYNKEFTKLDHINDIINYEKKYTLYVANQAEMFGYNLKVHEPYFLGFGGAAIAYKVERDNIPYVLKLFWGSLSPISLFIQELEGYSKVKLKLSAFVVNFYKAYFDFNNNLGLIIMDYAGISLERYMDANPSRENIIHICRQLKELNEAMIANKIYHNDLHSDNITVSEDHNGYPKIYIIDFEEVKDQPDRDFSKFAMTFNRYCQETNISL